MSNQIKLNLQGKNVPQKVQLIREVVTQLTGNANYPTPAPTLAVLSGVADTLRDAFSAQGIAEQAAMTATTNLGTAENDADAKLNTLSHSRPSWERVGWRRAT